MKVYKYRGGSSDILARDLESVVNNYFWAPTADQLNDPSEAYVNDREILKLLKVLGAKDAEASFDSLLRMRHTVGVFSLSKTPLDELMWAFYAENNTGFCIEYNLNRLILEARVEWNVVNVAYCPKPQTIIFEDLFQAKDETSVLEKMIGTKSSRWAHEEEIRIITTTSGRNHYASAAITGIYFGCRCDKDFIQDFRQKLKGRGLKYYRMDFAADSYQVTPHELQYDSKIDGELIEHLAPIEDMAIPDIKDINEQNKPYYYNLEKAVEFVRRDTSCKRISLVDFSTDKTQGGKPVVFVQYETNVPMVHYHTLNWFFAVEDIEKWPFNKGV